MFNLNTIDNFLELPQMEQFKIAFLQGIKQDTFEEETLQLSCESEFSDDKIKALKLSKYSGKVNSVTFWLARHHHYGWVILSTSNNNTIASNMYRPYHGYANIGFDREEFANMVAHTGL